MESQGVRRRINTIAGHFATAAEDISGAATHVFPMNCSSSLNSAIRRFDSRMNFARQGSSSQACFMRQASMDQSSSAQANVPLKGSISSSVDSSNTLESPLFSKPAKMEPDFSYMGSVKPMARECEFSAPEPQFARPNRTTSARQQFYSIKKIPSFRSGGFERTPRMDVAESARNYILMVELPGVSISDIRVEVNEQRLTVTGKNSTHCWTMASSNETMSAYHKMEVSRGPFQVVWPLPSNVNKEHVSAEFVSLGSNPSLFFCLL